MLRSILLRSGRGGQTGRTKYCAELTTIAASRYRARASRPSARKRSLRGFLIDRAATPPLRGGGYSSQTKTPDFQTESLTEVSLPDPKKRFPISNLCSWHVIEDHQMSLFDNVVVWPVRYCLHKMLRNRDVHPLQFRDEEAGLGQRTGGNFSHQLGVIRIQLVEER